MPASSEELPLDDMLAVLERASPRSLTVKEIADRLGLEHYDRRAMSSALNAKAEERRLQQVGKTRWRFAHEVVEKRARPLRKRGSPSEIVGRFTRTRSGHCFVEPRSGGIEVLSGDILIPRGRQGDALHGDRVRVQLLRRDHRTGRASGRVVAVVERAHTEILGRLELVAGARWRSIPSGWRLLPFSELLPPIEVVGVEPPRRDQDGRTALVRLTRGPVGGSPWRGEVVRLLGDLDDPEVQFLSVALEHGLRVEFPAAVTAEAARLPRDPRASDVRGREDLRSLPFVTIDGETARDFDDAICLEDAPSGGFRLRVAIADVSHYVQPGSALDAEAALRGTSVYFPDRAIPMLPERLSNELCSLNPGRDRAVVVADMDYDQQGQRLAARLCRAVIRSQARLTYTEVAAILGKTDLDRLEERKKELAGLLPGLERMRDLMRLLYRRRVEAGSLDLDLPEAAVELSEEGRAVGVRYTERNDAHRMIEEFMLEANQAVAAELAEAKIPIPYRIHEPPEASDIYELNAFLHAAGAHIDTRSQITPVAVGNALRALRGHPLERVLSRQILRALKQARYDTENVGHFGLAFSLYCHFTSPIRRYPDLLVHRQLLQWLDGKGETARAAAPEIVAASEESSRREREAMEAERAMVDLKKAEFMLGHMLEPEAATVVSVAGFGFFAELDAYPVEGLVRIEDLPGEWRFDDRSRSLYGVRSGRRLELGDRVVVEATEVSLARRQVTFGLLEIEEGPARKRPGGPAKPSSGARGGPPPRARGRGGAPGKGRGGSGERRGGPSTGRKGPPRGKRPKR